jgi:hypothetical protein
MAKLITAPLDKSESAVKSDAHGWLEPGVPQPPGQNHLTESDLWRLAIQAEIFSERTFQESKEGYKLNSLD